MREIEFRGKRLDNGDWAYGSYQADVVLFDKHTIIYSDNEGFYCEDEVIPETVGQYIGQKDINGIKVFTGDMVKADLYEPGYMYMAHPYICEVVFEGFCYMLRVIDHADKSRFKPGRVPKISKLMQYHYINSADNLTVIGNRWDNPELLEVK